jgi:glycosyltransferase involved in cell wall biosynthesis
MPMLISVHHATALTDEALATPSERSRLRALRRAVDGGAFVHTPTQAVRDVLVDGLGLPASRIVVIPFGTPSLVPKNPAAVDQWLPPRTDRYVVAIGEDLPRKGFRYLLQAFADVADEDPQLGLVLIGRCTQQQREDVPRLRHGNRIMRTGPLSGPQAGTLLHGAAALVYPSLSEGFGFPPLQAMAAGVPVIASDLPALREVAGDAALFATPRDAGGLAHALSVLLHNSALQRDLIIRGRSRVENFRFETSAAQFAEIYRLLHARR